MKLDLILPHICSMNSVFASVQTQLQNFDLRGELLQLADPYWGESSAIYQTLVHFFNPSLNQFIKIL